MTSPIQVLLVDDDEDNRASTAEYLELVGFDVVGVRTAWEALAAVESATPDAAVIDLNLPDATGEELARALKQQPQAAHVPLIVVSGRRVHVAEGIGAGDFAAVLQKPADPALIAKEIRRYLGAESTRA